jgi:hypothetical protein
MIPELVVKPPVVVNQGAGSSALVAPLTARSPLPPQIAREGQPARGALFLQSHVGRGPRRQGFARAGNAALDRSGPPQRIIRYEKSWLLIGRFLRLPTRSRLSRSYIAETPRYTQGKTKPMPAAQSAKEKMHAPVFSLAASAATPKNEETNPNPQPDVWPGRRGFFKNEPNLDCRFCLGFD